MDDKGTPTSLGKYQILGALGRGSMGIVYKAQDPEIGRFVAIKTLRALDGSAASDKDRVLEAVRQEARAAGNLRHPNIVTIFEVGRDGEMPFLVMDYVEGETLAEIIKTRGALSVNETLKILWQVAAGLDYAHEKRVLHKDIKPGNILIDRGGRVFLLDFGISALSLNLEQGPQAGPTLGSPAYMAPEQIANQITDYRSDLFSLGIVAFEMFTGKRPFPGDTFTDVVGSIVNNRKLSLMEVAPQLPLALEAEFERALAAKASNRFGSAQAMVDAFATACGVELVVRSAMVQSPSVSPLDFSTTPTRSSVASARVVGSGVSSTFGSGSATPPPAGSTQANADSNKALLLFLSIIAVLVGGVMLAIMSLMHHAPSETKTPVIANNSEVGVLPALPAENSITEKMTDLQIITILGTSASTEQDLSASIAEGVRRRISGAVPMLIALLKHDSFQIRLAAIEGLMKLGDRQAVPALEQSLNDFDPLVRGYAARALGVLGDKQALGFLNTRLGLEEVAEVKGAIRRAIEKINLNSVK